MTSWTERIERGNPDDCWRWLGYHNPNGYPRVSINYQMILVHRLVAELKYGDISGQFVHHTCENRGCLNPKHLILVKDQEEHKRLHSKTRCRRGHPYDEENTYIRPDNGTRQCRICKYLAKEGLKVSSSIEHSRLKQTYLLEMVTAGSTWSQIWQTASYEDKGEILLAARKQYPDLKLSEVHDRLLNGTI